jgi:cell division protein FtsB
MFWQILFVLVLLIPILAIVLDSQVGRALASRLERKGLGQPDDLLQERLMYLEGEVERLSKEVGRLDDESQFLQQLLEKRPGGAAALPPGDDDT